MIRRRRLVAVVGVVAFTLLVGRVLAVLFGEHEWYESLGAASVWSERVRHAIALHFGLAAIAAGFAAANVAAMRSSIMALSLPRRLGNVEFGEAVPARDINRAAVILALLAGTVMGFLGPSWILFATARAGVRFGEEDPYFGLDLGHYVSWLPFERGLYGWAVLLVALVTLMVVLLYALTPGLRLQRGRLRVSPHVRRHMSVLGAAALLLLAWRYRLDAYGLLVEGSGPGGAFAYVDHKWASPAYIFVSIVTVAAAALVGVTGWNGQVKTSFLALTAVIIVSFASLHVLPFLLRQVPPAGLQRLRDKPYLATREAFTRRAFGDDTARSILAGEQGGRSDTVDSAAIERMLARHARAAIVYPGAGGTLIVSDSGGRIAAPALGSGFPRIAQAWAQQDLSLLSAILPYQPRIVSIRDVRERITTLVPALAQGSVVAPRFRGDTLYWSLRLYSSSRSYPLSASRPVAGEKRSYFRLAATAVANASTGRVTVFPVAAPDPVAAAWIARHPDLFVSPKNSWLGELSITPFQQEAAPRSFSFPGADSTFRGRVTTLYERMRAALASGDLAAFGRAYDSLGKVVTPPQR